MRATLAAALLLAPAVCLAQPALDPVVRGELLTTTQQLGELMRQNVEVVTVEIDQALPVTVPGLKPGNGVLVPFAVEGMGGGNVFQEYVALFQTMTPDEEFLGDFGHTGNPISMWRC